MDFNYKSNDKIEDKGKNIEIDEKEENEEEEINSDEYVSSSMLDVDTNTYINQTLTNTSNIKLIYEKELKPKKSDKEKKIINIYSNKENNQLINKNEKNLNILTINQNNMIPLKNFFCDNGESKKLISKKINEYNSIKSNEEHFSYNSNIIKKKKKKTIKK